MTCLQIKEGRMGDGRHASMDIEAWALLDGLTGLAVAESALAVSPRIACVHAQRRVPVMAGVDLGSLEAEALV